MDNFEFVDDILLGKLENKIFASFSSGYYGFLTLLRLGTDRNIWKNIGNDCHGDLVYKTNDYEIRILNGGYPVNFNSSGTSDQTFKYLNIMRMHFFSLTTIIYK